MRTAELIELYEYDAWANARILNAAEQLSEVQFDAQTGFGMGSVRATLTHLVSAVWIWRMRLQEGISPREQLTLAEFAQIEQLRTRLEDEQRRLREYVASLSEEQLEGELEYSTTRGTPMRTKLRHILTHLVLHSMQHRAEAAAMLTLMEQSPGDIDLIVFVRQ